MFSLLRGLKAGVKAFTMLDDADPGTVTDADGGLSGYTDQTDGRYFSFTQFCHLLDSIDVANRSLPLFPRYPESA